MNNTKASLVHAFRVISMQKGLVYYMSVLIGIALACFLGAFVDVSMGKGVLMPVNVVSVVMSKNNIFKKQVMREIAGWQTLLEDCEAIPCSYHAELMAEADALQEKNAKAQAKGETVYAANMLARDFIAKEAEKDQLFSLTSAPAYSSATLYDKKMLVNTRKLEDEQYVMALRLHSCEHDTCPMRPTYVKLLSCLLEDVCSLGQIEYCPGSKGPLVNHIDEVVLNQTRDGSYAKDTCLEMYIKYMDVGILHSLLSLRKNK